MRLRRPRLLAGVIALAILSMASATAAGALDRYDQPSCTKMQQPQEKNFKRVVRDFKSNKTLVIEGPKWNDTLIIGCVISDVKGDGISVRNVRNLTIMGCDISDVSETGIRLRSTGSTSNVTIIGNRIEDTGSDGISAAKREKNGVDHTNLVIGWNTLRNTGKRGRDGLQHAIYSQASDAVIVSNVIKANREGNGISIRSSGIVACNSISGTSKSRKPGIRYFADHSSGPSSRLVIRNNTISGAVVGIELIEPPRAKKKKPGSLVHKFEISGNRSTSNPVFAVDEFWLKSSFATISQWNNKNISE